ncbi:MAG: hypothetical protein Q8R90_07610 [Bacteroidales bacterium]|jgi:hypothetical protein|nr:hypothetical protein [Bacteroidales bacterium]MDZ4058812.1 hypothetical protein [Bacteroidales bacterium]
MEKSLVNQLGLVSLTQHESIFITGGNGGWDYDLAQYIGMGVGYGVKKIWRVFRFLSQNLYEMQANTQVIYK